MNPIYEDISTATIYYPEEKKSVIVDGHLYTPVGESDNNVSLGTRVVCLVGLICMIAASILIVPLFSETFRKVVGFTWQWLTAEKKVYIHHVRFKPGLGELQKATFKSESGIIDRIIKALPSSDLESIGWFFKINLAGWTIESQYHLKNVNKKDIKDIGAWGRWVVAESLKELLKDRKNDTSVVDRIDCSVIMLSKGLDGKILTKHLGIGYSSEIPEGEVFSNTEGVPEKYKHSLSVQLK